MILLDERQEVLMLVTNSLKNDLNSQNQYIIGLALTALGNICSTEMARDLAPEVERLLGSTNPYIRKKAALCARRVLRKIPDMLESFVDRASDLLNDRNHAVILAGVTLMLEIADIEPATIAIFRDQTAAVCRILRALLMGGFSAEYDVGGIADPYLQVKLLRLLRILGHGSAEASDTMSDVLAQVATNTEGSRSAGNAILYECVRTIMSVESIGGLRVLAVNTLGRFLTHRDNNIRYVALTTLARVVAIDGQAVQRHRSVIVECVKDPDASIRKKALELVYALVNEGNVRSLIAELLEYLKICDAEFKPDLAAKICVLIQRYAPDTRWYVNSMIRTLREAGRYVNEEAWRALLVLILNSQQLHGYAARALYRALRTLGSAAAPSLIASAVWTIGEYGELVVSLSGGRTGKGWLEGEHVDDTAITENDLVQTVRSILERQDVPMYCREYSITALAKLSTRFPSMSSTIQGILDQHSNSTALEEQTRSVEYGRLFDHGQIRGQVLEHVPALEEAAYDAALDVETEKESDGAVGAANAAVDLAALLGLDVDGDVAAPVSGVRSAATNDSGGSVGGLSALQDLLSDTTSAVPSAVQHRFVAYSNDVISIYFTLKKGLTEGSVDILAEYVNKSAESITGFTLQAAVPKFMQLKLDPASSMALLPFSDGTPGSAATQAIHVVNSMSGKKSLVMRLRLLYSVGGKEVVQLAEVDSFPAGF